MGIEINIDLEVVVSNDNDNDKDEVFFVWNIWYAKACWSLFPAGSIFRDSQTCYKTEAEYEPIKCLCSDFIRWSCIVETIITPYCH